MSEARATRDDGAVAVTERLLLRRLTEEDGAFMLALVNQPSFLRYIGDRGVRTVDDAVTYLRNGAMASYATNGFGLYRVEQRSHGTAIGICGLIRRDGLDMPDIGFAFLPEFWSQGYAREAADAVIEQGRSTHALTRLAAITDPENASSIRLLERLGFRPVRPMRLSPDSTEVLLFERAL